MTFYLWIDVQVPKRVVAQVTHILEHHVSIRGLKTALYLGWIFIILLCLLTLDIFNSLDPGGCCSKIKLVDFKATSMTYIWSFSCEIVNVTRPRWWLVNIISGNGLVPSGNKPLPEPMLTQIYVAIWRH